MNVRHHITEQPDTRNGRSVPRFALRPQEAADSMGVSLGTFQKWVAEGKMPKPIKIGAVCLYDTETVRKSWEALREAPDTDNGNDFG